MMVLSFILESTFGSLNSDQGGKGKEKLAAFTFLAFHSDISAMSQHNFSGDAQAKPRAFVSAFRKTKEFVKDAAPHFLGHTRSLVPDGKANDLGPFPRCLERYRAAER